MSPEVWNTFAEIIGGEAVRGPVLEIGSVPGPDSLLNLPSLDGIREKIGINIEPYPSSEMIQMVTGNANCMEMFADRYFGCVLCNSTLEHDPFFWKTVAEIRRVTMPGGLVVIGVPGYRGMGPRTLAPPHSLLGRGLALLATLTRNDALRAGTITLGEHFFPGDYYRFTEQAMREVLLQHFLSPQCRWIMTPPRIIGWARQP